MTARIRWEPSGNDCDVAAASRGYVGQLDAALFAIYPPAEVLGRVREWVLRSDLPGQDHQFAEAPRREDLEPHAERWLEEHVSSLGASFGTDQIIRWRDVRAGDLVLLGDSLITAERAEVVQKPWGDGTTFPAVDIGHRLEHGVLVTDERHGDRYTAVRRDTGQERTEEGGRPANGNCPALACSHLWSLHGPDGCTGKVFPAHSLTGEPCPCNRTGDGEPR